MDKLFTSFDHLVASFDHLFTFVNQFTQFGINWSVIWADSSIYICTWLISMIVLTIWSARNYRNSVREEYLVKVTSARIAWEEEREKLESENRLLTEAFAQYRTDVQIIKPKRNEKGQFITTTGKGHGTRK